jgi:hypothetical protein
MWDYIHGSRDTSQVHEYLIHFLWFRDSDTTSTFWQLQGTIVSQLRTLHDLQVVVAIILPDHDSQSIKSFVKTLKSNSWKITSSEVSFPDQGK